MPCEHDLSERESACADGYCPLCMSEGIRRLRDDLATSERLRAHATTELAKDSALVELLRAKLIRAYQFISPLSDPMGVSNTEIAKELMDVLEMESVNSFLAGGEVVQGFICNAETLISPLKMKTAWKKP